MAENNDAGQAINGHASKLVTIDEPPAGLFLNNKYVQGRGKQIKLVNPKDRSEISVVVRGASAEDVDEAVQNARLAFTEGEWPTWTGEKRGRVMNKLADLLDEHAPELAYLESICSGRPLGMLMGEVPTLTKVFRYYAGWADKIKGDSYPPEDGFYKIIRHEPLGVCAGITAWNASMLFCAWKSAPALASGNVVILKPSEKSPLGTLAMAKMFEAAGFPPGVFQVLVGEGQVGQLLASHMDVNKISFTGSTFTGRKIQQAAAASNLKRVTLELGGKSPAIIFRDADIDKAVFWTCLGITVNTGQVCAATSRVFVDRSISEEFLTKLKGAFEAITQSLGEDPQSLQCRYGPLVDEGQYEKVLKYIEDGKNLAKVLSGGERYEKVGNYVSPTIFIEPDTSASIYREEIFGPVLCVKVFETEEEALRLANDTEYGLSGAIFTQNLSQALRISNQVHSGTVCVNCNLMVGPQVPMGGFGSSGIGRELGEYGLRQYTETKTVWISMN